MKENVAKQLTYMKYLHNILNAWILGQTLLISRRNQSLVVSGCYIEKLLNVNLPNMHTNDLFLNLLGVEFSKSYLEVM